MRLVLASADRSSAKQDGVLACAPSRLQSDHCEAHTPKIARVGVRDFWVFGGCACGCTWAGWLCVCVHTRGFCEKWSLLSAAGWQGKWQPHLGRRGRRLIRQARRCKPRPEVAGFARKTLVSGSRPISHPPLPGPVAGSSRSRQNAGEELRGGRPSPKCHRPDPAVSAKTFPGSARVED